jgi:F420-dependent oxidoreductase-like protein
MRIGINTGLARGTALNDLLAQFERAEQAGFASAWLANIFGPDALTTLALAGQRTQRIELGTAVVPTYPRHPVALAQQVLTVQAATNNRLALGIGLSHKVVIETMFGLDYSKPILHTREYLSVLNGLLTGQSTKFEGKQYRVQAQLTVPHATPPPVLFAALGKQMLELAGKMAQGTITWMGGLKYLGETAVPIITQAARAAGRPAPRIAAGFPIIVTHKRDEARAAASKSFAVYATLPSYRAILDVEGAADAADVLITGDESAVEKQLQQLASVGVTDFSAAIFDVRDDPDARERTYQFLAGLARSGNYT